MPPTARRELTVDGVAVLVRESARARRIRLVVAPGRPPEVVVPVRSRPRVVDDFVRSQRPWLADKLAALQALDRRPPALPHRPGEVWVAGVPVAVVLDPGGRPRATMRDGRLVVSGPDAAATLDRWYRREARRRITEEVARHAPALGVQVAAVSVRDQRTRWGSCSRGGRLSFSWRLVLAPPPILTYVVQHELCHLREFNHSPRFWALVESVRPDWRDAAGWLRDHGRELHSHRPFGSVPPGSGSAVPEPGT